ncbi:thioredoxin domain-containing protein [Arthrobacter psychrolactophilus]
MGENPQHNPDNTQGWPPPTPPSYYGQQPYGQQPYSPFGAPQLKPETTNTLAIVSFVLAFFVSIAAVITGHLALSQIRRTGEKGRGFALAGVIIGYVSMATTVLAVIALIAFWGVIGPAFMNEMERQDAPTTEQGYASETLTGAAGMNAFGGITFGPQGAVIAPGTQSEDMNYETLELATGGLEGLGIAASADGAAVQAVVYLDFMCSHCADFEKANGAALTQLRDQGKITVEYRPVAFLNDATGDSYYSSLSAEAAACVADASPEKFEAFAAELFAHQPAMNTAGLDDTALAQLASGVGSEDITDCLYDWDMMDFVGESTFLATSYGITSVPAVYLDGQKWDGTDFADFSQKVLDAKK